MTACEIQFEAALRANAFRVRDRDDEIENAAVAATTFQKANGASGANFVVEVMLPSHPVARLIAPPNAGVEAYGGSVG